MLQWLTDIKQYFFPTETFFIKQNEENFEEKKRLLFIELSLKQITFQQAIKKAFSWQQDVIPGKISLKDYLSFLYELYAYLINQNTDFILTNQFLNKIRTFEQQMQKNPLTVFAHFKADLGEKFNREKINSLLDDYERLFLSSAFDYLKNAIAKFQSDTYRNQWQQLQIDFEKTFKSQSTPSKKKKNLKQKALVKAEKQTENIFSQLVLSVKKHPFFVGFMTFNFSAALVQAQTTNEFYVSPLNNNVVHNNPDSRIGFAAFTDNTFAVTWETSSGNIIINSFSRLGVPLLNETKVNPILGNQHNPAIANLDSNNLSIVWQDQSSGSSKIAGALLDKNLNKIANLNMTTAGLSGAQTNPSTAPFGTGSLICYVRNGGPNVLKFDNTGTLISTEFSVNVAGGGFVPFPATAKVTRLNNGNYVFIEDAFDTTDNQRLITSAFYTNTATGFITNGILEPKSLVNPFNINTAALSNGNFIYTYQEDQGTGFTTVFFKILTSTGTAITGVRAASSALARDQFSSSASALSNAGFAIAWQERNTVGRSIAKMKFFSSSGINVTSDIVLSSFANDNQSDPTLGILADGSLCALWKSTRVPQQGIYAKIFTTQISAINTHQIINYFPNQLFNLADIQIDAPVFVPFVSMQLTISNPLAGLLTTATSGTVTATYNTTSGVWFASGPLFNLNELLSNLAYQPAINFQNNFSITVNINDNNFSGPITDIILAFPIPPTTGTTGTTGTTATTGTTGTTATTATTATTGTTATTATTATTGSTGTTGTTASTGSTGTTATTATTGTTAIISNISAPGSTTTQLNNQSLAASSDNNNVAITGGSLGGGLVLTAIGALFFGYKYYQLHKKNQRAKEIMAATSSPK